jgi:uroporphyrinogen-III synthase
MRLLVTRPGSQADVFAGELRALGHEPIIDALLTCRPLDFDSAALLTADELAVTSVNALRALERSGSLSRALQIPLHCVGLETARQAQGLGFVSVASVSETAEALAGQLISTLDRNAKVVHVAGEHRAYDLAGALSREGLCCCTLTVYSMEASEQFDSKTRELLKSGRLDGVILMSPRTAEVFLTLCRRSQLTDQARKLFFFCISQSVAEKLQSLYPISVGVAERPNRQALLDLVSSSTVYGKLDARSSRD